MWVKKCGTPVTNLERAGHIILFIALIKTSGKYIMSEYVIMNVCIISLHVYMQFITPRNTDITGVR